MNTGLAQRAQSRATRAGPQPQPLPLFYRLSIPPSRWRPPEGHERAAHVVNDAVWRRGDFNVGRVQVKGRRSWEANEPIWANEVIYYNSVERPLRQLLTRIVVHHTDNSDPIKAVERSQQNRGYAALGYHFFIRQDGVVFEGRPIEVMGSHAGQGRSEGVLNDPDWASIGIVFQGDYHNADNWIFSSEAPAAQWTAFETLCRALRDIYALRNMVMHKEVLRSGEPTDCPGDHIAPRVEDFRRRLREGK
jgi:hypothetical protein